MAPSYLNCLINVSNTFTRLSTNSLLVVPKIALNGYGKGTFKMGAATL